MSFKRLQNDWKTQNTFDSKINLPTGIQRTLRYVWFAKNGSRKTVKFYGIKCVRFKRRLVRKTLNRIYENVPRRGTRVRRSCRIYILMWLDYASVYDGRAKAMPKIQAAFPSTTCRVKYKIQIQCTVCSINEPLLVWWKKKLEKIIVLQNAHFNVTILRCCIKFSYQFYVKCILSFNKPTVPKVFNDSTKDLTIFCYDLASSTSVKANTRLKYIWQIVNLTVKSLLVKVLHKCTVRYNILFLK